IDEYFTLNNDWSLLEYLLYRQKCTDFQPEKHKEHSRYTQNLSTIMNMKEANKGIIKKVGNALITFQVVFFYLFGSGDDPRFVVVHPVYDFFHISRQWTADREVMSYGSWWFRPDSSLIMIFQKNFGRTSTSSEKRKFSAIAERTALMEEHVTEVVSSTFEHYGKILRSNN
ncbi:14343_t:CDS:2, partial [Funneliformis geosporum]